MALNDQPVTDDTYWPSFPEVLSITDIAAIIGKSEPTAWRWLANGKIPAHHISKSWIVYREPLRRHLESPTRPAELPDAFLSRFPETLSVRELASILGKKPETTYSWLAAGVLPAKRIGTSWIIFKHHIVQLLAQTACGPGAALQRS